MKGMTLAIGIAIGSLVLAMGSVFVVNEAQTAIVLNLGRVVRSNVAPGLHFKLPLVETVHKFDRRILTLDAQPERYLTSEKKDVSVDFFVKWRIKDVREFYRASNGNEEAAMLRLTPIVKDALRNAINRLSLQEVVSGARSDLTTVLVETVNEGAATLGIEVVDVRIKRIELPSDSTVLTSVFERMRTERTKVANSLRAQGVEVSEKIRADAERQRQVLIAEAERDAQKLRGEGDASAAAIYAEAYTRDAGFYAFHRSLEAYRNAFADGRSVLVLDKDSEFLRYFDDSGRAPAQ